MRLVDQVTLQELVLPNDLLWTDELSWTPVVATNTYTLTGALIIEQGMRQAGRPITLQADPDMAWVRRSMVESLRAASSIAGRRFKLILEYPTDVRQFIVVFRHDSDPISASPVKGFPEHRADDWFRVSLKFLEVV